MIKKVFNFLLIILLLAQIAFLAVLKSSSVKNLISKELTKKLKLPLKWQKYDLSLKGVVITNWRFQKDDFCAEGELIKVKINWIKSIFNKKLIFNKASLYSNKIAFKNHTLDTNVKIVCYKKPASNLIFVSGSSNKIKLNVNFHLKDDELEKIKNLVEQIKENAGSDFSITLSDLKFNFANIFVIRSLSKDIYVSIISPKLDCIKYQSSLENLNLKFKIPIFEKGIFKAQAACDLFKYKQISLLHSNISVKNKSSLTQILSSEYNNFDAKIWSKLVFDNKIQSYLFAKSANLTNNNAALISNNHSSLASVKRKNQDLVKIKGIVEFDDTVLQKFCPHFDKIGNLQSKKIYAPFKITTKKLNLEKAKGSLISSNVKWNKNDKVNVFCNWQLDKNELQILNAFVNTTHWTTKGQVAYNFSKNTSRWLLNGNINPKDIYPLHAVLPHWWHNFWELFTFDKDYPSANLDFHINHNIYRAQDTAPLIIAKQFKSPLCYPQAPATSNLLSKIHIPDYLNIPYLTNEFKFFGYAAGDKFEFKNMAMDNLLVKFSAVPGYTKFEKIKLKANSEEAEAKVGWHYNLFNPEDQFWKTQANSSLSLKNLYKLSKGIIPQIESLCKDLDSPANLSLKGNFYGEQCSLLPTIPIRSVWKIFKPCTLFKFPFDQLYCELKNWPNCFSVDYLTGAYKDSKIELMGNFNERNKFSNFTLSAQDVPSSFIYKNPFLNDLGLKKIKDKEHSSFDLDLLVKGSLKDFESINGAGKGSFKSNNLRNANIFTPLAALFKVLPLNLPFSNLKKVQGEFAITKGIVQSDEIKIEGDLNEAKGKGNLNLANGKFNAEVNFSLINFKPFGISAMQTILNTFIPLPTKFLVIGEGTVKDPKWHVELSAFKKSR